MVRVSYTCNSYYPNLGYHIHVYNLSFTHNVKPQTRSSNKVQWSTTWSGPHLIMKTGTKKKSKKSSEPKDYSMFDADALSILFD